MKTNFQEVVQAFNTEQEVAGKFAETKKNLIAKYGNPNSEGNSWAQWLLTITTTLICILGSLAMKPQLPLASREESSLT